MTTRVLWMQPHPDHPAQGYWDHTIVQYLLADWDRDESVIPYGGDVDASTGAVVILPAAYADAERFGAFFSALPWCLLILTSDEESKFNFEQLIPHIDERHKVWVQYPKQGRHERASGFLPTGPSQWIRIPHYPGRNTQSGLMAFSGQVTTDERRNAFDAMQRVKGLTFLEATDGFGQGKPFRRYMGDLGNSRTAPAPAGPNTPDTFRLYEALNANTIPITRNDPWFEFMSGEPLGWPVIRESWDELPSLVEHTIIRSRYHRARSQAWWQQLRRKLRSDFARDMHELTGINVGLPITIIMTASPSPLHPSTDIFETTLASIFATGLEAELIVCFDGVRPEMEHRRRAYEWFLDEAVHIVEERGGMSLVFDEHEHQARMTRKALTYVRSPHILFVEHDTPLEPPIPWIALTSMLDSQDMDVVRFHHESEVLPVHEYLMRGPVIWRGEQHLRRTVQWSQRPHLARTNYYRRILEDHFDGGERIFIEDRMHSVVRTQDDKDPGGGDHRIYMLHNVLPAQGIRRSHHLDARAEDPKFE